MNEEASTSRLSGEQVLALRFAAHRQLARWSDRPALSAHQRAQRNALRSAVRILHDQAFARGCELRIAGTEGQRDG